MCTTNTIATVQVYTAFYKYGIRIRFTCMRVLKTVFVLMSTAQRIRRVIFFLHILLVSMGRWTRLYYIFRGLTFDGILDIDFIHIFHID